MTYTNTEKNRDFTQYTAIKRNHSLALQLNPDDVFNEQIFMEICADLLKYISSKQKEN